MCLNNANLKKNFYLSNSVDKKLLSKNIYGKFFAKTNLLGNKNITVVENNDLFLHADKATFSSKLPSLGSSIDADLVSYSSVINDSLKFKGFDFKNKTSKTPFLSSMFDSISYVGHSSTSSLFVVSSIKGGFICVSNGLIGFLPRRQGVQLFSAAMSSVFRFENKSALLNVLNFLLDKNNFFKRTVGLRLPHLWGKTIAYNSFNAARFSRDTRSNLSTCLSFIFVSKQGSSYKKPLKS